MPYMRTWRPAAGRSIEQMLGTDYYFVHFNRYPGMADAVLDDNDAPLPRNLYRRTSRSPPPSPATP